METVEFALAVTAMALGIRALSYFGKARSFYSQIYLSQTNYTNAQGYYSQQTYQQQYNQQNNYQQQYYRQQYNQQNYQQQDYQQYPRQDYYQQSPQQGYTQTTVSPQTTYNFSTLSEPAEKICPSCGVVNDGKNRMCVLCGKPL